MGFKKLFRVPAGSFVRFGAGFAFCFFAECTNKPPFWKFGRSLARRKNGPKLGAEAIWGFPNSLTPTELVYGVQVGSLVRFGRVLPFLPQHKGTSLN